MPSPAVNASYTLRVGTINNLVHFANGHFVDEDMSLAIASYAMKVDTDKSMQGRTRDPPSVDTKYKRTILMVSS